MKHHKLSSILHCKNQGTYLRNLKTENHTKKQKSSVLQGIFLYNHLHAKTTENLSTKNTWDILSCKDPPLLPEDHITSSLDPDGSLYFSLLFRDRRTPHSYPCLMAHDRYSRGSRIWYSRREATFCEAFLHTQTPPCDRVGEIYVEKIIWPKYSIADSIVSRRSAPSVRGHLAWEKSGKITGNL